jgi:hypothetical protein
VPQWSGPGMGSVSPRAGQGRDTTLTTGQYTAPLLVCFSNIILLLRPQQNVGQIHT